VSTGTSFARAVRRGSAALLLPTLAAVACSNGNTPDCSDAQCGTFTMLPPLDATLDTAAPDGGEDSGDAEEEGDDAATPTGTDGSSDASDASVDQSAAPTDASDDAHDDAHITDSGHDSSD
jgi:hypothetical protein